MIGDILRVLFLYIQRALFLYIQCSLERLGDLPSDGWDACFFRLTRARTLTHENLWQDRAEELEALAAIFADDFRLVADDTFELSVELPDSRRLELLCHLPENYPSQTTPLFELKAAWLGHDDEAALAAGLESVAAAHVGQVIVFKWTEFLREESVSLTTPPTPPRVSLAPPAQPSSHGRVEENVEGDGSKAGGGEVEDQEGGMLSAFEDEDLSKLSISATQRRHADGYGAKRSGLVVAAEVARWEAQIHHGEPFCDRKSTFQAHMAPVFSAEEVKAFVAVLNSNSKIARATHNIMAFRLVSESGNLHGDCDDDGESAAGGRLLHLLEILGVKNVCVVVSRWYGGIQLGPDRCPNLKPKT